HGMIGESLRMKEVYQFIGRAGPTDRPVLITGETGTGKDLAARAIHQNSPRSRKPFVAVNCAAFTETLLQSELFGHEKGAFTGADTQRKGLFEAADGGTLFLDEIGELPITMQADLLRVLQHGDPYASVSACRGNQPRSPSSSGLVQLAGDVRELENAIERGIALGVTPDIRPQDLPK